MGINLVLDWLPHQLEGTQPRVAVSSSNQVGALCMVDSSMQAALHTHKLHKNNFLDASYLLPSTRYPTVASPYQGYLAETPKTYTHPTECFVCHNSSWDLDMSSVFWWLNPVRLYSLYNILYPKGGYNLTLYWVPWYPPIKYYSYELQSIFPT